MQSSGGLMTAATMKERLVNTILSGPVKAWSEAPSSACWQGTRPVTFDMGTSCDVATVVKAANWGTHSRRRIPCAHRWSTSR
jgi:N-methylhydantoinase A/oxoprolinase/acetone carboxylase beta subunit